MLEELPFDAATTAEILVQHLHAAPTSPSELWPAIPYQLEDLLIEMLAKDPMRRPTMPEVVQRMKPIAALLRPHRARMVTQQQQVANAHRLVEDHLRSHPAIKDVAIVGDQDRVSRALVVATERINESDLLAFCRASFPDRLCPKAFTVLAQSASPRMR